MIPTRARWRREKRIRTRLPVVDHHWSTQRRTFTLVQQIMRADLAGVKEELANTHCLRKLNQLARIADAQFCRRLEELGANKGPWNDKLDGMLAIERALAQRIAEVGGWSPAGSWPAAEAAAADADAVVDMEEDSAPPASLKRKNEDEDLPADSEASGRGRSKRHRRWWVQVRKRLVKLVRTRIMAQVAEKGESSTAAAAAAAGVTMMETDDGLTAAAVAGWGGSRRCFQEDEAGKVVRTAGKEPVESEDWNRVKMTELRAQPWLVQQLLRTAGVGVGGDDALMGVLGAQDLEMLAKVAREVQEDGKSESKSALAAEAGAGPAVASTSSASHDDDAQDGLSELFQAACLVGLVNE